MASLHCPSLEASLQGFLGGEHDTSARTRMTSRRRRFQSIHPHTRSALREMDRVSQSEAYYCNCFCIALSRNANTTGTGSMHHTCESSHVCLSVSSCNDATMHMLGYRGSNRSHPAPPSYARSILMTAHAYKLQMPAYALWRRL